jgi:hypothetical protein
MPRNGLYSKADATQKLVGAISRLSKNQLQSAVYLLVDALGMLEQLADRELIETRAALPDYILADHLGAAPGLHGVGFRKAKVNELIGQAIGETRVEAWQQAAWHIKDAAELVRRLGMAQNKTIAIRSTPDSLARHQVKEEDDHV